MIRFHESLEPLLEPIGDVTQHPQNPRNGDVEAIAESIHRNGVYRAVIAQRSSGHIVAGNHTYAALLSMNAHQVPVIWVDVDDDHALRILLADNRTADLGGYDDSLLLDVLTRAANADEMGLLGTGYDIDDLDRLQRIADEPFDARQFDRHEAARKHCPNCGWSLGAA